MLTLLSCNFSPGFSDFFLEVKPISLRMSIFEIDLVDFFIPLVWVFIEFVDLTLLNLARLVCSRTSSRYLVPSGDLKEEIAPLRSRKISLKVGLYFSLYSWVAHLSWEIMPFWRFWLYPISSSFSLFCLWLFKGSLYKEVVSNRDRIRVLIW